MARSYQGLKDEAAIGLSGWALFTAGSVPDSGATVMLLSAALGALGVVRRLFMC